MLCQPVLLIEFREIRSAVEESLTWIAALVEFVIRLTFMPAAEEFLLTEMPYLPGEEMVFPEIFPVFPPF